MEEDLEEIKFEELEDVLEDLEDLTEIDDAGKYSFSKFYGPIRSQFAADSELLDKFSACIDHKERLRLLLGMEVVKNCLSDVKAVREVMGPDHPNLPPYPPPESERQTPSGWKKPPKLSHGSNKKYPHLSKAVEVKTSPTEGRHMVAKQKILPGEVIVVDPAYTTSLFYQHYATHCLTCFCRILNEEESVPCPGCGKVKFCSPACLAAGFHSSHRWECPVMEYLDNEEIGRMATLAYRIVTITGFNLLSGMDSQAEREPKYTAGDYLSVFHQEANVDVRPVGDHLKRCVTGLILTRCLQISGWFPSELCQDLGADEVLTVASILVRHIQSCACNAYEVNEFIKKGCSMVECESIELGGAVYPTISLSNHACSSNTSRTNFGTFGVVRATKTIFPKERVWDNYGYFFHMEDTEHRKNMLSVQYFFNCQCMACKENWPTYRDLAGKEVEFFCPACKYGLGNKVEKVKKCPRCKKELKGLAKTSRQIIELHRDFRTIMDGIAEGNAEENISRYSGLLTEIEKVCKMPCREVITCQQILLQCFAVLGNSHKVELDPASSQLVSFGGRRDSSSEDFSSDDDDDDMPLLI